MEEEGEKTPDRESGKDPKRGSLFRRYALARTNVVA
jgi:hypothetical protein